MKKFSAILLAVIMMLSMVAMASGDVVTTGDITIINSSTEKTYTLYKVFDATYSGSNVSYTYTGNVTEDMKAGPFTFTESTTAGTWVVTKDEGATDSAIITWVSANAETIGTKITEKTGNGGELKFDGLAFGYYYITTGTDTVVTIDSAIPSVSVRDKNPTEPNVPEDEELKTVAGEDENVAVGDTATFTVQFVAVNYKTTNDGTEKITQYVVTDTPTNMDIDSTKDNITVTVDSTEITNFTVTEDETTGKVTITIPWVDTTAEAKHLYSSPVDVVITYDAVIEDAAAENGAKNSVTVVDSEGTTLDDEVELTTVDIKIYKYTMVDGVKTKLDGAEFKLYDAVTGGNQIYVTDVGNGVYSVTTTENDVVIKAGEVTIKGLDADKTYYIEETTAPAGYNKLTSRVSIAAANVTSTNDNGETVVELATAEIENNTGTELPSTGGMGTTLFYVVGSLMMAAAVVILVAKKKVAAK